MTCPRLMKTGCHNVVLLTLSTVVKNIAENCEQLGQHNIGACMHPVFINLEQVIIFNVSYIIIFLSESVLLC